MLRDSLYRIQKKDIEKTGQILAEAFRGDPVWEAVFKDARPIQWESFFQGPARFGTVYGNAFAPSEKIEGLAVWVPSSRADMTLWRGLRCGSLKTTMRMGMRTLRTMLPVFSPLERDRRKNMGAREYLYLMVLGVAPEKQGMGYGGKLLRALIEESEMKRLPVYLETSKDKNVRLYEKFGFSVINKMIHPVIDLPQWEMVRECP